MFDHSQSLSSGCAFLSARRNRFGSGNRPLYDITTYIPDYRASFDRIRFSMLESAGATLVDLFGYCVLSTLIGECESTGSSGRSSCFGLSSGLSGNGLIVCSVS